MITCDIGRGFGNDLFIIAAASYIANKNNIEFIMPPWNKTISDNHNGYRIQGIEDYHDIFESNFTVRKEIFQSTNWELYYEKRKFLYDPIVFDGNTKIVGSFQNTKYFDNNYVRKIFYPSNNIVKYINEKYNNPLNRDICSIHVRRGDYVRLSNYHPPQKMEYFNKAIEIIGNKSDLFFIFSDDIQWCKDNFKGKNFVFIEGEKNWTDLFLMSFCKHNIISNSTFSWWSAYLNCNKNKIVVFPKKWLGDDLSYDTSDLCPQEWINV